MKLQQNLFGRVFTSPTSARTRQIAASAVLVLGCSGEVGVAPGSGAGMGAGTGTTTGVGAGTTTDGATVVTNPDGSTVIVNPDGSTSTVVTNPDGSTVVVNPDGTTTEVVMNPDGTVATTATTTTADTTTDATTSGTPCAPGVPETSQLPRLTKAQYDKTILELTGLNTQPSTMLAPDTPGSVDQRAWDGYQTAAAALAPAIMADAVARAKVITCTPDADGTACANQFIAEFGQRAFRRPLTPAETTRFQDLYTNRATLTETGSFDEAAELIIRGFLVSPSFLMRTEITEQPAGEYLALSGYEVASRLSYLLWGSMPDEALFAAAAADALSSPEQILAEAQRMLADPKARLNVAAFHQRYAHMGDGTRWAEIDRDPALYPMFNQTQVPLLSQETSALFDYIVFDQGGTFQDLLTTPVAMVNADLAPLYGLDAAAYGADLTPVQLEGRPGVFTRAGFLTSYSVYDRSSPILRGAFLQKEVLCTQIGVPPADAANAVLPTEGLTTNRERVDAQTAGATCVGCHHGIINPTGFALESFNAVGAVQTTDNGAPVDTTASVPMGSSTVDVTGPADFMTALANSPEAQRCYAQKWVEYAYERLPNSADACVVDQMTANLTTGGYTVLNLIADLTQADQFRYRTVGPAEEAL